MEKRNQVNDAKEIFAEIMAIRNRMAVIAKTVTDNPEKKWEWPRGEYNPSKDKQMALSNMAARDTAEQIMHLNKVPANHTAMPELILTKIYSDTKDEVIGSEEYFTEHTPETDRVFMDLVRALPNRLDLLTWEHLSALDKVQPDYWHDEENDCNAYDMGDDHRDEAGMADDFLLKLIGFYLLPGHHGYEETLGLVITAGIWGNDRYWLQTTDQFWIILWMMRDLEHSWEINAYLHRDDVVKFRTFLNALVYNLDHYYWKDIPITTELDLITLRYEG